MDYSTFPQGGRLDHSTALGVTFPSPHIQSQPPKLHLVAFFLSHALFHYEQKLHHLLSHPSITLRLLLYCLHATGPKKPRSLSPSAQVMCLRPQLPPWQTSPDTVQFSPTPPKWGAAHWDTPTCACCAAFGWDRVRFLHSSYYGAMVWICAGNSVDNTGMFWLLLSSAYTESRPFLLLTPPHQRAGWGFTRS